MPYVEEAIVIAAPVPAVFAHLADPARGREWMPNLVSVERTSAVAEGPGVETMMVIDVAGRHSTGTGRCVEWDPPHWIVMESRFDLGLTATTAFELSERDTGTELRAQLEYTLQAQGLAGLVGGLFGEGVARRELRKTLESFKRSVESA